jgi:hypothetical protein
VSAPQGRREARRPKRRVQVQAVGRARLVARDVVPGSSMGGWLVRKGLIKLFWKWHRLPRPAMPAAGLFGAGEGHWKRGPLEARTQPPRLAPRRRFRRGGAPRALRARSRAVYREARSDGADRDWPMAENALRYGDDLEVLRVFGAESVNLISMDPPSVRTGRTTSSSVASPCRAEPLPVWPLHCRRRVAWSVGPSMGHPLLDGKASVGPWLVAKGDGTVNPAMVRDSARGSPAIRLRWAFSSS